MENDTIEEDIFEQKKEEIVSATPILALRSMDRKKAKKKTRQKVAKNAEHKAAKERQSLLSFAHSFSGSLLLAQRCLPQ